MTATESGSGQLEGRNEVESTRVPVPDLGQPELNGSTGANNGSDSATNALAGLDALLSVLQNANASAPSNVVRAPSPGSFDFARSPTQVAGENAVQVAATALGQLSQVEAADTNHPLMYSGMIPSVCPFPRHDSFHHESSCTFGSSAASGLRRPSPNSNGTCPTRRSRPFCFRTTLINHRLTGCFRLSIGNVSRISIARSRQAC